MELIELKQPQSKSRKAVIDCLKNYLEMAYAGEVSLLEIFMRVDDIEHNAIVVGKRYSCRPHKEKD